MDSQSHILSQQTIGQGVWILFLSLSLEVVWVVIVYVLELDH